MLCNSRISGTPKKSPQGIRILAEISTQGYLNGIPRDWQTFIIFFFSGSCKYSLPCHHAAAILPPKASQHGRDDVWGIHRGWNITLLHKLLLLWARYRFPNQKWKMQFQHNGTVVTQKSICIILFLNLHKKWHADQHATLQRPLIISLFSNSIAKNILCVHSKLNCLLEQCYLWVPHHEEIMQTPWYSSYGDGMWKTMPSVVIQY